MGCAFIDGENKIENDTNTNNFFIKNV